VSTWASIESREATERKVTGESIATFSRCSSTIRHSAASSTAIRESEAEQWLTAHAKAMEKGGT